MYLRLIAVSAIGFLCVRTTFAEEPTAIQRDLTPEILDTLFNRAVTVEGNVNDMSLLELLNQLSKRYSITFAINEDSFKLANYPDIKEKKPTLGTTTLKGMTLHQFLNRVLESLNATYIVRGNAVEVVTVPYAARVGKATLEFEGESGSYLKEPLVCAIIRQKPFVETLESLASRYDLSITVNPLATELAAQPITARIMNLPADKAIETLALQCDLRVVRKGNAYVITKPEHAKTLLAEQTTQELNKLELEQFRANLLKSRVAPQQKTDVKSLPTNITSPPLPPNR